MTNQLLNNRYQIIRTLGAGGFGETFLAEDTHMPSRRRCVVKRLRPVQDNPQINQLVQERFQREAAILEKLGNGHQQIPELYAYFYGQTDQQFYLVQEWIDGDTLSSIAQQQGRLTEAEVRRLLIAILPVFDFIHRQSIIHRDVKPDNIIVRRSDQQPVLIDFGAVRETMGTTINSQGHPTRSIIIGTPGYMASEQSVGRPVYSSDFYSLGLTAIYLLTGHHPSEFAVDARTGEILWRAAAPQVSPALANILEHAIASHPRDRYQTATEFGGELQGQSSVPAATNEAKAQTNTETLAVSPAVSPTVQPTIPKVSLAPLASATTPKNDKSPRSRFLVLGGVIAGITGSSVLANLLQPSRSPIETPLTATNPVVSPATQAQPATTNPAMVSSTVRPFRSNVTTARPERTPPPRATNSATKNLLNSPTAKIPAACSYFAGKAIEGQLVNVDLCSISNVSNSAKVDFSYNLDNQSFASTANCVQGSWTTNFDQQVHRPLSPATKKMLDRICQGRAASSAETSSTPPTNSPESAPAVPARDPAQNITQYYQAINNRNYPQAWQQLPIALQSNTTIHPQGYNSFVQWWDSVAAVDLESIQTTKQTAQQALVQVSAVYRMKNNRSQPFTLRYILGWNEANQEWSIEQIRRR